MGNYFGMAGRKRSAEESLESLSQEALAASEQAKSSVKRRRTDSFDPQKFGGMSEDQVCKLQLPDHVEPGLDIIFIGTNPSLHSAHLGHHYCTINNHFWPCLHDSGLTPQKLSYKEDAEVLRYGIGLASLVPRTTASVEELSKKEIEEWSKVMTERLKELKPLIACFNSKGTYESYFGDKCDWGLQPEPIPGTDTLIYVMPSTSSLMTAYSKRADKLKFFNELSQLRDSQRKKKGLKPASEAYKKTLEVLTRDALLASEQARSTIKKKSSEPLDAKKFGGMTEEEVCKRELPDHMRPGLDIIFIGINPGLYSAYLGHHYCNQNNHFWPCLYESGLTPRKLTFKEDKEVLNYGIGVTNIVPRTTRAADELSKKEMREWSKVMIERIRELKPLIVCFNGKGIYEIFHGSKCELGLQPEPVEGTDTLIYVMPSTSGRVATYPKRADKVKFFNELKELRNDLRKKKGLKPASAVYATAATGGGASGSGSPSKASRSKK